MKRLKKRIAAALLSAALCAAGFAGCGSTPTWAVQDGERTLPVSRSLRETATMKLAKAMLMG